MALSEFGKAFKAARDKGDMEFELKGKKYTTKRKDDKSEAAYKETQRRKREPLTSSTATPSDMSTARVEKNVRMGPSPEPIPEGVPEADSADNAGLKKGGKVAAKKTPAVKKITKPGVKSSASKAPFAMPAMKCGGKVAKKKAGGKVSKGRC